jgi:glutamate synthase (NADPH/NADH) small chain
MVYEILSKNEIAPNTVVFRVHCPHVARSFRPGQFLILKHNASTAERIPLSVADFSPDEGTLTLVVMAVGRTSTEIVQNYGVGDTFFSILGPLGISVGIEKLSGAFLAVGGGFGAGALLPIARAFKRAGNRVLGVVGARTESLLVFEKELSSLCDKFVVTTNDGSKGIKGLVTDGIGRLTQHEEVGLVMCIGPVAMMRAVAELTRPLGIHTLASINPIMVDGTGMCGGCRVTVGGKPRFTCFEGPKFDAHQVDFDDLISRIDAYKYHEKRAADFGGNSKCESDLALDLLEKVTGSPENCPVRYTSEEPVLPEGISLPVPMKQRMKVPRQPVPHQAPEERVHNFAEVMASFVPELAVSEAYRCIECKDAPCIQGCPVGIDIKSFIRRVREERFEDAYRIITRDNLFPAICGRVCPQEDQCEAVCTAGKKVLPVAIGRLERFVADYVRMQDLPAPLPVRAPSNGKSVAVIGSGPSGLSCSFELAVRGYRVVLYEALHKPGGVLSYGIPTFRLPREVVSYEVDRLRELGVEILVDHLIGRTLTLEELLAGFDAVFIGTGAGHPVMLNLPGELLKGVYTANEFLIRINLMHANEFPQHPTPVHLGENVAVIGAGNTAMDAARVSLRLGAKNVYLVYRRGRQDMPARREEVENAAEEGVQFLEFSVPVEFRGDERNFVKEMVCAKTEYFGEPDPTDSQKRRFVREIPGSRFQLKVDTVINALGFVVNPLIPQTSPGLKTGRKNIIVADESGRTSMDRVFAGGDAITGGSTVISALGQGKRAAQAVHSMLAGDPLSSEEVPVACSSDA